MSYDVTFGFRKNPPTYPKSEWRNYTSNVSPMWTMALGGLTLGDLIDLAKTNEDMIPALRSAVHHMEANPGVYIDMNPANGWGDYRGALDFLRWMLEMAEAVPDGTCDVWR